MECKKCDRNPFCDYRINATTAGEQSKGEYHFISGLDCPKDWQDKRVEDMTKEQLKEAVKELRKKLLTENKSAEENMAQTGLLKEETTETTGEWKLTYKKPPLGCKPSWVSSCERIAELSEAITRNINGVHKDVKNIRKWATEILYHCEIMEKC